MKMMRRMMQMRAAETDDEDKMIVEGYAAVFNSKTTIWESRWSGYKYTEQIAEGAFDGAEMSRTVFKYNHGDNGLVLARVSNDTLSLSTDSKGLKVRAEIAQTTAGRDLYTLIKRGDLDKMSFAFTVAESTYKDIEDEKEYLTTIDRFDEIFDVSVVDFPAYDDTSIMARSGDDTAYYRKLDEQRLREKRRRLMLMSMC